MNERKPSLTLTWLRRMVALFIGLILLLAVVFLVVIVADALFGNEENYDQPGPAGDAWNQTLAFLEGKLASAD